VGGGECASRTFLAWLGCVDEAAVAVFEVIPKYEAPRLLDARDSIEGFECRSAEQTQWLRHHARQAHSMGTSKVLVVTVAKSTDVVAYYAWCMASLSSADSPVRLAKGAGRYPQPIALLARLGVSTEHERRGLGAGLLVDVISRTAELGAKIGCRGLVVHAENAEARDFYMHLVPEFERSPTDELHLVLLMKDIAKTLKR
jgi:GNAT superfamily N-acetyltransferase